MGNPKSTFSEVKMHVFCLDYGKSFDIVYLSNQKIFFLNNIQQANFHYFWREQLLYWFYCITPKSGDSNSDWLTGRMRLKVRSRGPHWKKIKKKTLNFEANWLYISLKIWIFLHVGGPHWTLRGTRVWDTCPKLNKFMFIMVINKIIS